MDEQNKNLILATALSFLVILVWFVLFPPEEPVAQDPEAAALQTPADGNALTPTAAESVAAPTSIAATPAETRAQAVAASPRIAIETPRLTGSLALSGGRLDDLSLKDYSETLQEGSPIVTLLSPVGGPQAYYALFGWAPGGALGFDQVPGAETPWNAPANATLTPESPVTLTWDNGAGLVFSRTISVDADYMFTVTQSVRNTGDTEARLAPYGIIAQHEEPADLKNFFILHEGALQMADGVVTSTKYSNLPDMDLDPARGALVNRLDVTESGWLGFTSQYWMTALVPQQGTPFTSRIIYQESTGNFIAEELRETITVAPGATAETTTRLFAGAKEWETIRHYQNDGGVENFIDSIDWGWFYFLTKPIFAALHWLNLLISNMGLAIIALTLGIKALLFPLAYKSYVSMARMKELQPEMEKIKERVGDDREKLQKEMMELYKTKKVNPAAGCLPILLQIPIFFSLYKVIFVTLELRHAPFFGPFQDLSAPDPTSIMNLFGLLPWGAPVPGSILALVLIGILPLLLGISMWLQQKLNPAPTDPTQAMIFAWLPWVFMFMLGSFASGLIVYWIANNVITFTQQYLIMRSQGYTPDLLGNIKSGLAKATKSDDAANSNKKPK